jgi:hypothetical protein
VEGNSNPKTVAHNTFEDRDSHDWSHATIAPSDLMGTHLIIRFHRWNWSGEEMPRE